MRDVDAEGRHWGGACVCFLFRSGRDDADLICSLWALCLYGGLFKSLQFDSGSRVIPNRHLIDIIRRFGAPAGATASPSDRRDVLPNLSRTEKPCATIVCQALTQSNSTNWYGASKISSKSRGAKKSGVRRTFPCAEAVVVACGYMRQNITQKCGRKYSIRRSR